MSRWKLLGDSRVFSQAVCPRTPRVLADSTRLESRLKLRQRAEGWTIDESGVGKKGRYPAWRDIRSQGYSRSRLHFQEREREREREKERERERWNWIGESEGNGLTNSLIRVGWKEGERVLTRRDTRFFFHAVRDSTRLYSLCLKYLLISLSSRLLCRGLIEFLWRTWNGEFRDDSYEQSTHTNRWLDVPVCVCACVLYRSYGRQRHNTGDCHRVAESFDRRAQACHCREPRDPLGHRSLDIAVIDVRFQNLEVFDISGVLDP